MSIRAIDWAFNQQIDSPSVKFVLVKLADNANDEGFCWPSVIYICKHTGLARSTVQRCVKALENGGWLKIERRKIGDAYVSNIYTLQINQTLSKKDVDFEGGSPTVRLPSPTVRLGGSPTVGPEPSYSEPSLNRNPPASPDASRGSFKEKFKKWESEASNKDPALVAQLLSGSLARGRRAQGGSP